MPQSVGIIGCGWLGFALAKQLIIEKHRVSVTTQSVDKQASLLANNIDAELLSLPVNDPKSVVLSAFNQEVLVISITPQIRQGRSDYAEKVEQLVEMAEIGKVKKIILLSTTAVYNGLTGIVDENSSLDFTAEKVTLIAGAEAAAQQFTGQTVILRLAGLVGPNRHPGRFLQGKRVLAEPQAFINLIHQSDAVGVLINIITENTYSGTYNAVSATETSKEHYYQSAANALGLAVPEFSFETAMRFGKRINDAKLRGKLNYQFIYDDLIVWLYKSAAENDDV